MKNKLYFLYTFFIILLHMHRGGAKGIEIEPWLIYKNVLPYLSLIEAANPVGYHYSQTGQKL